MITKSKFIAKFIEYGLESKYTIFELEKLFSNANGCGAKGGIKFPSTMYFISIVSACIIHDIEWAMAICYQDLIDANERFDNNLKTITDSKSSNNLMRWLRRLRIAKYVSGVELVGTDAYAKERDFVILEDFSGAF